MKVMKKTQTHHETYPISVKTVGVLEVNEDGTTNVGS